jgi:hypothetical protein
MKKVAGRDLKVGDIIGVWWSSPAQPYPRREMIESIRPYKGKLSHLWPMGANLVSFTVNRTGMTIGNDDDVERFNSWSEVVLY